MPAASTRHYEVLLPADQFGRPIADAATGSWTTAPLFSKINEVVADDSNFITSETLSVVGNTSNADLTLTSGIADPISSVGHVIRVRAQDTLTLGTVGTLKAELRQGATLIATLTAALTTSYAVYQYTLSGSEADSITDYTGLFIRLYGVFGTGNLGGIQVSWLELEVPPAPTPTVITDSETPSSLDAGESLVDTVTDSESPLGLDAGEAILIPSTDNETASAADAGELVQIVNLINNSESPMSADAGESIQILVFVSDTEIPSGLDSGEGITVPQSEVDGGYTDDGDISFNAVLQFDAGVSFNGFGLGGTESIGLIAIEAVTSADSGESVAITVPVSETESTTSSDGIPDIVVSPIDTDQGSIAELEFLSVSALDSEIAAALDGELTVATILAAQDSATSNDGSEGVSSSFSNQDSGSAIDGSENVSFIGRGKLTVQARADGKVLVQMQA